MLWFGLATHFWKQLSRGQTPCLKLGPLGLYGHTQCPDSQSLKTTVVKNVISLHIVHNNHCTRSGRCKCAITAVAWNGTKPSDAFPSMTAFASFHSGKALRKYVGARERVQEGFRTSVGSQINTVIKDLRVMGSRGWLEPHKAKPHHCNLCNLYSVHFYIF